MYQNLKTELNDYIALIYIDRADKLNALNIQLLQELGAEIQRLENDPSVRSILITGTGEKAFAAGADIAEFANFSVDEASKMSRDGHAVFNAIESCSKPVIAAVNGFALGGGCELAMACHIRIASENAKFGQPEVKLGVPPGYGGTQRLAQLVGKGRALDMLITARTIDAETALEYGLVSEVVPLDGLIEHCLGILNRLDGNSPHAMGEVIRCTNALYAKADGFEIEIDSFSKSFGTGDFKEGTGAFLEKRKPSY